MITVYAKAGWGALLDPVVLGIVALMAVAAAWSRLYPELMHYPVATSDPSPPSLNWGGWRDDESPWR